MDGFTLPRFRGKLRPERLTGRISLAWSGTRGSSIISQGPNGSNFYFNCKHHELYYIYIIIVSITRPKFNMAN